MFDPARGETIIMRSKEDAHDYRYFPEPDLPPLLIEDSWIEKIRAEIPELPGPRKDRFVREYGLPNADAITLTEEKPLADYYEEVARASNHPKAAANWVLGEVLHLLKEKKLRIGELLFTSKDLAGMIGLLDIGTISGKIAKTVFEEMSRTGKPPGEIVREKNLVQITDEKAIVAAVEEAIRTNGKAVDQYLQGKQQALGFLVGQIMKGTRGKANPALANRLLRERLEELRKS